MRKGLIEATDFVCVLENEFQSRMAKNKQYSLRAFARDLLISPSRLSDFLKRRRGLTDKTAVRISERLRFSERETKFFVQLARCSPTKSARIRKAASLQKENLLQLSRIKQMSAADFEKVSDWFHFAILELTHIKELQPLTPQKAAKLLSISLQEAELAFDTLLKKGFLERTDSGLQDTQLFLDVGGQIPSACIRKFHKQILSKLITAIDSQPVSERLLGTSIMAIRKGEHKAAMQAIEDFRHDFGVQFGPTARESSDELYAASFNFFKLTTRS